MRGVAAEQADSFLGWRKLGRRPQFGSKHHEGGREPGTSISSRTPASRTARLLCPKRLRHTAATHFRGHPEEGARRGALLSRGALQPILPDTHSGPAVANAIYDAVGVRLDALPFTPARVLAALRAKGH